MGTTSVYRRVGAGASGKPASEFPGPRGLVPRGPRHLFSEFLLFSAAALGCFVLGAWLETLLHPTSVGSVMLGLAAFAGYLLLGRKALMALVPGLDRRWRRDGRDRMSQTHLTKNADKG